MPKVFELKAQRTAKVAEARKILETAIAENRDNTPEERQSMTAIEAAIDGLGRQIASLERIEAFEADGQRSQGRRTEEMDDESNPGDGPDLNGKHPYSLLRAYRCAFNLERGGLEAEVSQEIAKRCERNPKGIFVPWNLGQQRSARESRALSTTTGAGGIANILGTGLIALLRNRSVLAVMGANFMSDMIGGTFSLPKQTGTVQAYHVAEGLPPTASNMTIGQVTWTPKELAAFTDLTRSFMLQTSLDAEATARNDLIMSMGVAFDYYGLNGLGNQFQPLGLLQNPNIPTLALGTNGGLPTWANAVGLEKLVAVANAEFGSIGYVTSNAGRAIMKQTPKIGTTFPVFLWEGDKDGVGEVNGRKAMASEQIPSNLTKGSSGAICSAMLYGNWASAAYALWGGLDVLVDPYTGSSAGSVRFVAYQNYDFQCRYEAAFAKTVDMLPA